MGLPGEAGCRWSGCFEFRPGFMSRSSRSGDRVGPSQARGRWEEGSLVYLFLPNITLGREFGPE